MKTFDSTYMLFPNSRMPKPFLQLRMLKAVKW